jgi:hypothetical protein
VFGNEIERDLAEADRNRSRQADAFRFGEAERVDERASASGAADAD